MRHDRAQETSRFAALVCFHICNVCNIGADLVLGPTSLFCMSPGHSSLITDGSDSLLGLLGFGLESGPVKASRLQLLVCPPVCGSSEGLRR